MKLNFSIVKDVAAGSYPDVMLFGDSQAQLFYIRNGELYGANLEGESWQTKTIGEEEKKSNDKDVNNFELKVLQGWGAVGSYKSGDMHKMIIYEF